MDEKFDSKYQSSYLGPFGSTPCCGLWIVEAQSCGVVFGNPKTNYTARLGSYASAFSAPLSRSTATNAFLGYLVQAQRVTADPAAEVKTHAIATYVGKINVPTITMVGLADSITPAGASILWWTIHY